MGTRDDRKKFDLGQGCRDVGAQIRQGDEAGIGHDRDIGPVVADVTASFMLRLPPPHMDGGVGPNLWCHK